MKNALSAVMCLPCISYYTKVHFVRLRAYFRAVLATLCGLGHLECGLANFEVWSTFPLSCAFYFVEVFLFFGLHVLYVDFANSSTCVSTAESAKDDRSNYRPISVLPFISRLFEKLIFNQFYEYLDA